MNIKETKEKFREKMKDMRFVERLLMFFGILTMVLFAAGYFLSFFFFYCFLVSMLILFVIWIGFWKCPHCGRNLWYNFDRPCKHCNGNIYEKPEPKPKNTAERTGYFNW